MRPGCLGRMGVKEQGTAFSVALIPLRTITIDSSCGHPIHWQNFDLQGRNSWLGRLRRVPSILRRMS